ncbi:MAG: hypothetical protein IJM58_01620 [Muribaculaceae bacterium]|nr:hypothetical protein [Muribaculaceae bacterium]
MNKIIKKLIIVSALTLLSACVSPTRLNFSCDDPTLDIFIDGEYAGKALVNYVFPNSKQDVVVSCYDGTKEVYRRTFSKEGRVNNELIELQIEQNLQYSSGGRKAKTY